MGISTMSNQLQSMELVYLVLAQLISEQHPELG